jgi:hypothetical protein
MRRNWLMAKKRIRRKGELLSYDGQLYRLECKRIPYDPSHAPCDYCDMEDICHKGRGDRISSKTCVAADHKDGIGGPDPELQMDYYAYVYEKLDPLYADLKKVKEADNEKIQKTPDKNG